MRTTIDHLIVICADLDQGARWAEARLGVTAEPGGRHPTMGTHNRLLKLGPRVFLELLAIDPQAAAPAQPRWFDLDRAQTRGRAAQAPFLATWVAATDELPEAVAHVPALGEIHTLARDAFTWRMSLPDGGRLAFGGVLPTLIQWNGTAAGEGAHIPAAEDAAGRAAGQSAAEGGVGSAHPCDALTDQGCALLALQLSHPAAGSILPLFRTLRVTGPVELNSGPIALVARLQTPRGLVEIS